MPCMDQVTESSDHYVLKFSGGGAKQGSRGTQGVIRCILKNVMSLQTRAREDELLLELEMVEWDVVILNETWRSSKQESWKSE
eukprot:8164617-Karenia_brevis.AAC.1